MTVHFSQAALDSVSAALAHKGKGMTDEERAFDEAVAACIPKPGGHVQPPSDKARLYTVTTIAASARFGGKRTPVICSTFEKARDIVEGNVGDIWEYSYSLVVVESITPDHLYNIGGAEERYWWRWEGDRDGGYVPIEEPEAFKNVLGHGIG